MGIHNYVSGGYMLRHGEWALPLQEGGPHLWWSQCTMVEVIEAPVELRQFPKGNPR